MLLGNTTWRSMTFAYGALTLYGARFHNASASDRLCNSMKALPYFRVGPTTPLQHRRQAVPLQRFRLFPFRSPLLGESRLFSFPRGTEMFQFPRFAPFENGDGTRIPPGCTIRPSRDHCVCVTPPGLSQLTTAFIASVCPGIPHMPSLA